MSGMLLAIKVAKTQLSCAYGDLNTAIYHSVHFPRQRTLINLSLSQLHTNKKFLEGRYSLLYNSVIVGNIRIRRRYTNSYISYDYGVIKSVIYYSGIQVMSA
ncbi:hypothetical protein PHYBLDRAFT_60453 [Phycomyces blakesleeanus NRRL 1555(-)]|uniref:Uncharacterized protein n=1 Tax=Phycomyces blakesleeanus (strain ATCC 8743b / DSM 1359 / FGSC 10004 / NBRC 33097 / NRRL 1555) TaxID=763407 RepID=A0A167P657_PHYB8|nr:hypothetical protein PHYBLDRAFT_60453 [Phycomyces blakesleeanus NRRL 1555(-)]OAD77324.1 hypothetical protein PHYBLDRAFT_60453 [Phycomyces blakesleeanus NRRL 1555(-)]|eukprot:XP_018295364.1 hypothetical protein PHYBLDRAFT_60453 [Phycomyces blakesleeanus NRRL 1555(-)]